MKINYTKITMFFAATTLSFAAHALHECHVVEYAELKDMQTIELESLASRFHYNYMQLNNIPFLPADAKTREREICNREAQRIANVINKRTNVKKNSICNAECRTFSGMNLGKVNK